MRPVFQASVFEAPNGAPPGPDVLLNLNAAPREKALTETTMEASAPVLPLVTPFHSGDRDRGRENCTIKDVIHQSTAAELQATGDVRADVRHAEAETRSDVKQSEADIRDALRQAEASIRDSLRDVSQRLDNEIVVNRFEQAKSEAAISRDIAATKCEVIASVDRNAKETQREVFESRVRAEILAKETQLAAERCCCETKELIRADGEKTRELFRSTKEADLRADLAVLRTRVPPPVI